MNSGQSLLRYPRAEYTQFPFLVMWKMKAIYRGNERATVIEWAARIFNDFVALQFDKLRAFNGVILEGV